jgi:hypothetical protein
MELKINDVLGIIQTIKNTYPYSFKNLDIDDEKELENELNNTANLWFALLSDYPRELVIKGFHEALKAEKVNIVPAAIIEQIEKIENAFAKSDQELWAEFRRVLNKANDCVYKLKFKMIEENGKTQGENAQLELERLYEGLPLPLQRYCGNVSGLKDLSQLDDESLEFEKARFLKDIGKKKAEIKIQQECPQFAELAQGTLKALEG